MIKIIRRSIATIIHAARLFRRLLTYLSKLDQLIDSLQQAIGRIEKRQLQPFYSSAKSLHDVEFKVTSQGGEDGIIQYLIHTVPIERSIFVEFGVENYSEANTRFLLQNDQWSGLVIDGSADNVAAIKQNPIYWKCNLKAECSFIDRDNINDLISRNGITGDIGILSIDIDGNDYWVWQTIHCISPRIVICEYNSIFGPHAKISVPYDKFFSRTKAHYSNLYWGASISALTELAGSKGYSLVGSNRSGNNVFFVRKDVQGKVRTLSPAEAYVKVQFRESRDAAGRLTYLDHAEGLRLIGDLPVVEVSSQEAAPLNKFVRLS